MNEHKFPYESFIGGWYMPEKLCDDIINYYHSHSLSTWHVYNNSDTFPVFFLYRKTRHMSSFPYLNLRLLSKR